MLTRPEPGAFDSSGAREPMKKITPCHEYVLLAQGSGPLGLECFVVCSFTTSPCQLHFVVLALEAPRRSLTLHHLFRQSSLPLSVLKPGTVKVRGPTYDCTNLRELRSRCFSIVLLVVPFGIKNGAHLEKLEIPLEFGREVCAREIEPIRPCRRFFRLS